MRDLLLCTDLDRTLLPNGPQPESPGARTRLARLVARPEVTLAFVSGRRLELQLAAIEEYALPLPAYCVADVGTTIYRRNGPDWEQLPDWHDEIAESWRGKSVAELAELLEDVAGLRMQEPAAQGRFKLSYEAPPETAHAPLVAVVRARLRRAGIRASVIWSVDETGPTGLLDVLPENATKLHAVRFLMRRGGFKTENVLYAGDSGNDLPVFTSGIPSVLVANATDEFRAEAERAVRAAGCEGTFLTARGGHGGMNGCYAAGILEGLEHFVPESRDWL